MTIKAGAEAERAQHEQAVWQILRRKQGYVTHRLYQQCDDPLQRLVYSEWESAKAVDGARQHLQSTPLLRRGRATLVAAPQRLVVDLVGPITSTKGLDLAPTAVALSAIGRFSGVPEDWRQREELLTKQLAAQAGYITAVLFRGFADPLLVGSLSHWEDAATCEPVRAMIAGATTDVPVAAALEYVCYRALRD